MTIVQEATKKIRLYDAVLDFLFIIGAISLLILVLVFIGVLVKHTMNIEEAIKWILSGCESGCFVIFNFGFTVIKASLFDLLGLAVIALLTCYILNKKRESLVDKWIEEEIYIKARLVPINIVEIIQKAHKRKENSE